MVLMNLHNVITRLVTAGVLTWIQENQFPTQQLNPVHWIAGNTVRDEKITDYINFISPLGQSNTTLPV